MAKRIAPVFVRFVLCCRLVRSALHCTARHGTDFFPKYVTECDLDRIISSSQALSDEHTQYFIYQTLRALKFIHSANVLHRDLKPSNLLVNSNCDLAVCDFGLARGVAEDETLTEYVVTRWYRAPELLTEAQKYGPGVDIWSMGCILAEVINRKPLFRGRDYMNQLEVIISVIGTPTGEDLDFITNDAARKHIQNMPYSEKVPLAKVLPKASALALDLIEKMLVFNPNKRITTEGTSTRL